MKRMLTITIPILVLLGLFFAPTIMNSIENARLQNEIDRITTKSGIAPSSVECRNVEFAQICYVSYSSLDVNNVEQMLVLNGYTLVDQQHNSDGKISATNQDAKIRVDSEFTNETKSTFKLKFKDINVTL